MVKERFYRKRKNNKNRLSKTENNLFLSSIKKQITMDNEKNTEKLAGYIIKLACLAIVVALCWYFKNVLIYIVAALVVTLLGRPLMKVMRKVKIKGKSAPDWLLAMLSILIIIALIILLISQIIPLVSSIIRDASAIAESSYFESNPIDKINEWLIGVFPGLDRNFDIAALVMDKVKEVVDFGKVGGIVGSVASMVTSLLVAAFAVVFISFFFLKENGLFGRIVCAFVPDKHELTMNKTLNEIKELLSRYFVGLFIEMLGVALVDFLGLWLIARLNFNYAIGIAFIAGLLNVIPYVGPIIGEAIGVLIGIVLKLGTGAGLDVNIWVFALIILAIMLTAQLIDNFIYQPLIYSTSIKAHPLEIFIVLLMAGHIGGTIGMLVAVPAYTIVRVIAIRFFYRFKPIQRLVPDLEEEDKIIENID